MSRGLRNRNPGNIRRSGVRYKGEVRPSTDPAFKQFGSMALGYRAIFVLVETYRIRYGTGAYIRTVCRLTGLDADRKIDTRDRATMTALAAAISRVENGTEAVMRDVEAGWELFCDEK